MGRTKTITAMLAMLSVSATVMAQDYFDDVYYNPKKDTSTREVVEKKTESTYIANMADMDIDTYNRRGEQYYVSQIDTIGSVVENGEDFVYTQQIQKYYNPTIVLDNANALGDVLSNAYGNVDIVINNNGYPVFAPLYAYDWPYYTSVWSPWSWGFNIGPWGWNIGFYDPWYSWNWGWGPSWSWGPSWGWGPVWSPGPGPAPGWGPNPPFYANWRPRGNRAVGPRPGWSAPRPQPGNMVIAPRPVSNFRGPSGMGTQGVRPGGMHASTGRPTGVVNNGGKWEYNTSAATGHRTQGTGVLPGRNNQSTGGSVARPTTNGNQSNKNTVTNNHRTTNSTNRNSVTNNNSNRNTYGTGNRNTGINRSSGGGRSGGGGHSTGGRGGGGGRHR